METSGTIICLRCAEPLGAIKYGLDDLYPLCHDCAFPKAKAKCYGCRAQATEIARLRYVLAELSGCQHLADNEGHTCIELWPECERDEAEDEVWCSGCIADAALRGEGEK